MHRHYNENIQIQTSFVNIVSFLSTTSLISFVLHHLIGDKKNLNKIKKTILNEGEHVQNRQRHKLTPTTYQM